MAELLNYKCPHCDTEFEMSSETHFLKCNHCGVIYDYLEKLADDVQDKKVSSYGSYGYRACGE